jgi:hypothetical protein
MIETERTVGQRKMDRKAVRLIDRQWHLNRKMQRESRQIYKEHC